MSTRVKLRGHQPTPLPPLISTGISPAPASRRNLAGGCSASKVSKLLRKMADLQLVEEKQRQYFCPKAGSPIKGILNCDAHLDTWSTREHHRYADVLMADRFRDHELEIFQRIRQRRLEKRTSAREVDALDRPSLIPIEMMPSERALFHRPKQSHNTAAQRSKSCEPSTANMGEINERQQPAGSTAPGRAVSLSKGARWTKEVDLKTGKTYYFDSQNGLTTWNAPPQFEIEHDRFRHLQKRKQQERNARDEMINLRASIEEDPRLLEKIKVAGCFDPSLEAMIAASSEQIKPPASQSLREASATSPRNLEDMASDASTFAASSLPSGATGPHEMRGGSLETKIEDACYEKGGHREGTILNNDQTSHHEQMAPQMQSGKRDGVAHVAGDVALIESTRFVKVRGPNLEGIGHVQCLKQLGTVLVIDVAEGTISRLSDELSPSKAAVLLQRNYRMRRSRLAVERKYFAQDYWRYLSKVACHLFNRTMALLLNTTTDRMLDRSTLELKKTAQIAEDVHHALVQLQTNAKTRKGGKEDYRRFCLASGIRFLESRGSQLDPLLEPDFGKSKKMSGKRCSTVLRRTRSGKDSPIIRMTRSAGKTAAAAAANRQRASVDR